MVHGQFYFPKMAATLSLCHMFFSHWDSDIPLKERWGRWSLLLHKGDLVIVVNWSLVTPKSRACEIIWLLIGFLGLLHRRNPDSLWGGPHREKLRSPTQSPDQTPYRWPKPTWMRLVGSIFSSPTLAAAVDAAWNKAQLSLPSSATFVNR